MRRAFVALAVLCALTLGPSSALAAKAQPFTYSLVGSADSIYGSWLPHTCLTEDSARQWSGTGSLRETFTTTVTYCDSPLSPGGQGLAASVTTRRAHDLSITYPDGTTVHGDRLCVVSPEVFIGTIAPGTYTITLTADWRDVSLDVESGMASASWRQGHCS
jgi:hypothetical protein